MSPNNEVALYNLGYIYYKKDKLDTALKIFKRAEKLIKDYAPLYFNIGRILYYKKDYYKALSYVSKALKMVKGKNILYKWGLANIYVRLYQKAKGPKLKKRYRKIARKYLEECIYNKKKAVISTLARKKILEVEPTGKYLYTVQYEIDKKFLPQIVANIIYSYSFKTKEITKRYKETGEKIWSIKIPGKPICQYKVGAKEFFVGVETGEVLVLDNKSGKIKYRIDKEVSEIIPTRGGVVLLSDDTSRIYYYEGEKEVWDAELFMYKGEKNRVVAAKDVLYFNNKKLIYIDGKSGSKKWEFKGSVVSANLYKNMVCLEVKEKGKRYVVGLKEDNGKKLWRISVSSELAQKPYFSYNYIVLLLKNNTLIACDNNGKPQWNKKMKNRVTSAVIKEAQLLCADTSNTVYSYKVNTGKILWKYTLDKSKIASNKFYTVYYRE